MSPSENTRQRSDAFAAQNGLPKLEYVLHPRTTGFTFIVDRLRKGEDVSHNTVEYRFCHLDGNMSSGKHMPVPDLMIPVDPAGFFMPQTCVFHAFASHYYTSEILWFLDELMLAVLQDSYPIPVPPTQPQLSKQVL